MDYLIEDDFFTMDPAVKRQWIDDLRSGGIKQGQYKLHRVTGEMCCLGVLSWRAADMGVVSMSFGKDVVTYGVSDASLVSEVCRWAGLTKPGHHGVRATASGLLPFLSREGNSVYLDGLNDSGFSFSQIADLIECFY